MNSFRDSLRRQLDRLRMKIEQHLQNNDGGDITTRSDSAGIESKRVSNRCIIFDLSKIQYL